MKKYIYLIVTVTIVTIGALFTSCAPDYETDFKVDKLEVPHKGLATIVFPKEGGSKEVPVETNLPIERWNATSNAEWCSVEKHNDKVVISAGDNNIHTTRTALVTIAYGHQSYSIEVTQLGKESVLLVNGKRKGVIYNVESTQEDLTVKVTTNLKLDNIIVPDTVSWVTIDTKSLSSIQSDAIDKNIKFNIEHNTDTVPRYCEVILQSSQNYDYITRFIIKQNKRGYIVQVKDSDKEFTVPASGQVITVPFKVNGPEGNSYTYEIESSAQDWIKPVVASTRALRPAEKTFRILPSTVLNKRVGHITFTSTDPSENSSFVVTVTQEAFVPMPPKNVVNASATSGDGFIMLNWALPDEVDFTTMKISYYDPIRKKDVVKSIADNTTIQYKIDGTYKVAGEYTFTIKTYGPTGMETDNPVIVKGTSKASPKYKPIELSVDMLSTNAQEPSEGPIKHLIDGNPGTFFHSAWSVSVSAAHYLQVALPNSINGCKFWYKNRNNGNGKPQDVVITVSADGQTWSELAHITDGMPKGAGSEYESSDYSATTPFKHFRFTVEKTNSGSAPTFFNMAEFKIYEINAEDETWAENQ